MDPAQTIAIAATAATDQMPNATGSLDPNGTRTPKAKSRRTQPSNAIDPQLQGGREVDFVDDRPLKKVRPRVQPGPMEYPQSVSFASASNMPHSRYLNNFSVLPQANRPHVRGRFSEGRRKEVQNIRRQGACLRCRMLKKPVSRFFVRDTKCSLLNVHDSAQAEIRARHAKVLTLLDFGNSLVLGLNFRTISTFSPPACTWWLHSVV